MPMFNFQPGDLNRFAKEAMWCLFLFVMIVVLFIRPLGLHSVNPTGKLPHNLLYILSLCQTHIVHHIDDMNDESKIFYTRVVLVIGGMIVLALWLITHTFKLVHTYRFTKTEVNRVVYWLRAGLALYLIELSLLVILVLHGHLITILWPALLTVLSLVRLIGLSTLLWATFTLIRRHRGGAINNF